MISYLKGKIIYKGGHFAIVETGGVGYQVFLPESHLLKYKSGEIIEVFTHEYAREDSRELYGFGTAEELRFFWQLIGISGVGPKLAHKLISAYKLEKLEKAVSEGDLGILGTIPGVGKKTAQKIILELKGRLVTGKTVSGDNEIVDALVRLGYSKNEAQEAVGKIGEEVEGAENKIKAALKNLGK
ncbi:MAG: Holliday junction branch migration protein RuvA [Patescibacteria group bacterium]